MGTIYRAVGGGDLIKISVIEGRDIVEQARRIHGLSPTACAALGRTLCACSMMGEMMKEADASVTVRISGGGPIGSIVAVSDCAGNVRGYVEQPRCELPLRADGKLDVGGAVGRDGLLTVSRDIGLKEPYIGSVELVSGEIAEDFTRYYVESEQIPAACGLGVLVDTDRTVRAAGGFIVQLMPGAPEALIGKLEDNIFLMDALTTILDEDGAEEVVRQVLKGLEPRVLETKPAAYRCTCGRERILTALRSTGAETLRGLADTGEDAEVVCSFCGTVYRFPPDELRAAAERASGDAEK